MQTLLDGLLASYADPRFVPVALGTVLLSGLAFLAFAGPLTVLAARDPAWARRWRIQPGPARLEASEAAARGILVPGPAMVRQSLRQWAINNAFMLVATLGAWPLMSLAPVHLGPLPAPWLIALQLLVCIYLDDFLYYWLHRAMHGRFLLRHVHGRHHRILQPWAISGHYMHPVEYVLTGTLAYAGPALLGVHVVVLWLWILFRQWEAAEGHCGYAFPFSPTRWLPGSHGALHHDFHHARVRGNYAGFLPLWDRVFGTQVRDYDRALADWQARP